MYVFSLCAWFPLHRNQFPLRKSMKIKIDSVFIVWLLYFPKHTEVYVVPPLRNNLNATQRQLNPQNAVARFNDEKTFSYKLKFDWLKSISFCFTTYSFSCSCMRERVQRLYYYDVASASIKYYMEHGQWPHYCNHAAHTVTVLNFVLYTWFLFCVRARDLHWHLMCVVCCVLYVVHSHIISPINWCKAQTNGWLNSIYTNSTLDTVVTTQRGISIQNTSDSKLL